MLLAMYETMGVDGVAFTDGEEAMDWIDEVDSGNYRGELPELALIDIRLPGKVNGIQVAARMRKSPQLSSIAVVLMTAHRLSPRQESSAKRRSGASHLLYKPLPGFREFQAILQGLVVSADPG
jgi:CheY-like chemotaxis protein